MYACPLDNTANPLAILSDISFSMNWIFISTIVLPPQNADNATAQAATLVWNNLARQVNLRSSTRAQLLEAVIPLYGIAWSKAAINHLATNRINDVLSLLRRSELFQKKEYDSMTSFMKGAFAAAGSSPPDMLEWRTTAGRFRLDTSFGWGAILAVCTHLADSGISLPFDLRRITPSDAHQLARGSPAPAAFRALWSASRADSSAPSNSAAEYLAPAHEVFTKDSLLKATKCHSAQFSRTGGISVRTHTQLLQPAAFLKLGPAREIRLLKSAGVLPKAVGRFPNDITQANLLKQVKGSLSLAWLRPSAVIQTSANCVRFPPFPALEETAPQWSSVFNNTATFGNYISLLGRCCFFPGPPPTGKPPAWPTWLEASGNARIAVSDSPISPGALSSLKLRSANPAAANSHMRHSSHSGSPWEFPRRPWCCEEITPRVRWEPFAHNMIRL